MEINFPAMPNLKMNNLQNFSGLSLRIKWSLLSKSSEYHLIVDFLIFFFAKYNLSQKKKCFADMSLFRKEGGGG